MADSRYDTFPVAPLLARWEKLSPKGRAAFQGYMDSTIKQAEAALYVAEEWTKADAVKPASTVTKLRAIKGGRHA